jgi:hypothetical protein
MNFESSKTMENDDSACVLAKETLL